MVAFSVLLTGFSPNARCDRVERVLILGSDARETLAQSIRLELESIGFKVAVVLKEPDPRPYQDFVSVAKQEGITAVIRLRGDRPIAEVWVADTESGRVIHRDVPLEEKAEAFQSQAAMEISELLRASALELHTVVPKVDPPPTVSTDEPAVQASARRPTNSRTGEAAERAPFKLYRLNLEAHSGITAGTFDYPPIAHLVMGVYWRFLDPLGVALSVYIPLTDAIAKRDAGKARLRPGWLGVGPRLTFADLTKRFRPSVGGGVGLIITKVEGNANPGWTPNAETALTTLLFLRLSAAAVLTERINLTVDGVLGRSFPNIIVNIDDRQAIAWGRIMVCALLGLEVGVL